MSFAVDLIRGQKVEDFLIEILREKYPSAVKIPNKFSYYDIWIPETEKRIEVKADYKWKETGNIVIEIEMFGKRSGLMITRANYWAFFDGEQFMFIQPKAIVNFIFLSKLRYVDFKGDGDNAPKKAFLVNKEELFAKGKIGSL